jgi:hypothetical protein
VKGICSSCRKQRYEVHAAKSVLIPSINLLMCKTCINKGFEPRHIIILAARSGKIRECRPFIVESKYEGEPIHASDILKSD